MQVVMNHYGIDALSLKLGAVIGVMVAAPMEYKVWAGVGYIVGVVTTWLTMKYLKNKDSTKS